MRLVLAWLGNREVMARARQTSPSKKTCRLRVFCTPPDRRCGGAARRGDGIVNRKGSDAQVRALDTPRSLSPSDRKLAELTRLFPLASP